MPGNLETSTAAVLSLPTEALNVMSEGSSQSTVRTFIAHKLIV